MKQVFRNKGQVECIFTEEGISMYNPNQAIYAPYGAIDTINMSLLGILQIVRHPQVFTFAVNHSDRGTMKEMIRYAREAMKGAERVDLKIVDVSPQARLVDHALPAEEQLKQFKALFVQGQITKDEYDMKKRQLQ